MAFLKRHWLYASVGLVVLLCVSLGTFLAWRANQPVEPKTVYALPKPNPKRAEILKQALQPPKRAYTPKASRDEATVNDAPAGNLQSANSESSSQDNDFEDEDLESALMEIDEETAEGNSDFPPVPEGYPFTPIWLGILGYKKGDKPEHEIAERVLMKLWKQGERGFTGGVFDRGNGKVYLLYPDVLYVEWAEEIIDNGDGNPLKFNMIVSSTGTKSRPFHVDDFITGEWKNKYPSVEFVEYQDAGYDPDTFLTEDD